MNCTDDSGLCLTAPHWPCTARPCQEGDAGRSCPSWPLRHLAGSKFGVLGLFIMLIY